MRSSQVVSVRCMCERATALPGERMSRPPEAVLAPQPTMWLRVRDCLPCAASVLKQGGIDVRKARRFRGFVIFLLGGFPCSVLWAVCMSNRTNIRQDASFSAAYLQQSVIIDYLDDRSLKKAPIVVVKSLTMKTWMFGEQIWSPILTHY